MSRQSVLMLGTKNELDYTGDSVRGDGFYGFSDSTKRLCCVHVKSLKTDYCRPRGRQNTGTFYLLDKARYAMKHAPD